jgi:hypothetical protein
MLPAAFVALPAEALDTAEYRDAVSRAVYCHRQGADEIHVPVARAHAQQILEGGAVRIASIIVSMDGRWWESEALHSGEQHMVVYRPGGRLRIDYSADEGKLTVPWPETQLRWAGEVHLREPLEIFGREWQVASWETVGNRTWLHLRFSRALRMPESQDALATGLRRSHPAFIDMAWGALESALAAAVLENNREAIEKLRRADLIPLGRALYRLSDAAKSRWRWNREMVEMQLKAVRYLQAEVSLQYGRVPWKILPTTVRDNFLKSRPDEHLLELLTQAFDGIPPELTQLSAGHGARLPSPPRAA